MVSPGSARTTSTPWTPGIPLSCAVSGAAGAAGPGAAVPRLAPGPMLPATWFDADTWSVSTCDSVTLPNRVRSLAFCVVIATTATVVMNSASTRPLTARKAALGSSARRRAAISVPGRLVHRAMTRAAAMVSHGPAMNRPTMMSAKLDTNAWTCPLIEAGWPCTAQKPSSARPASSGTTRQAPRRLRRRPAGDAERGDVHPAQRQPGRHGGGQRHADRDHEDVEQAERQVAREERRADERDARDRGAQQEEDPEPDRHPQDPRPRSIRWRRAGRPACGSRRPGASPRTAARGGRPTAGSRWR